MAFPYRTSLSCALVALFAVPACGNGPNWYSSEPYALSELSFEITANAAPYEGAGIDVRVRALADYRGRPVDLRLGDDDSLLASLDGRDTELQYGAPDYTGYLSNRGEDLNVLFVRARGRTVLPVPLAKPFKVTASPSAFVIGDKVTIDLSPRPTLSKDTTVVITPESCVGSSATIFVEELPYVWDTSKLTRTAGGPDAGVQAEACEVRLTTIVETRATGTRAPGPGIQARATRSVRSTIEVRP